MSSEMLSLIYIYKKQYRSDLTNAMSCQKAVWSEYKYKITTNLSASKRAFYIFTTFLKGMKEPRANISS